MKVKHFFLWRWCPQPERMKVTRTRPTDRAWVPLVASALILSLLAIQGAQMWAPSTVNAFQPVNYGTFPTVQPIAEQPTQLPSTSNIVTTASTEHFTVQFTFPASASPGNTITISTIATAKASVTVTSLSIDIFAYTNQQLAKATSSTIVSDKEVSSGTNWQTTLTVAIPPNTNRSMMVGTLTEIWKETTTSSNYPSNYWQYYSSNYPYYYPYYYPSYAHNYTYYYVYQPTYIPTSVTVQKSSQQTLPLTYVLATTPEYESVSAQYAALQQEYNALVAKQNDLTSKYDSLKSDYNQLASNYGQLKSENEAAAAELGNYRTYTYVLIIVTAALVVALVFLMFQRTQKNPQSSENSK
jgi:outer membrane murein-binding lipoprotein Lpp